MLRPANKGSSSDDVDQQMTNFSNPDFMTRGYQVGSSGEDAGGDHSDSEFYVDCKEVIFTPSNTGARSS